MLLPEDGTEAMMPPTLYDAELESSHWLERVDAAEHLLAASGARFTSGVDSSGQLHSLSRCLKGRPVLILN